MRLIDADLAIAEVQWAMSDSPSITRDDWRAIIEALSEVPSAQPERKTRQWIPVSERLPESKKEDLEYPIVIIDLSGQVALGCYYESTKEWGTGEYFNQKCFPIAWMPLPEPYKERQDG